MTAPKKYRHPDLAKPLEPLRLGPLAPKADHVKEFAGRISVVDRKLKLLMDHYEISEKAPDSWKSLAIALATEFIDGFQDRRGKGRTIKWGLYENGILVVEIDRLCASRGISVAKAARELSKQEPWKSALSTWKKSSFGADKPEALRRQYVRAKKHRFSNTIKKVYRSHEATGDLAGWQEMVNECFDSAET